MSQKYYLTCPACQRKHVVDVTVLGVPFACSCGKPDLEVASLRELRTLEPIVDATAKSEAPWGPRQGLMLLGGVIFLASAIVAGVIYWGIGNHTMQKFPIPRIEKDVADLSLIKTFEMWRLLRNTPIDSYAYSDEQMQENAALSYRYAVGSLQTWSAVFAGLAVVGLILHIIGWTIPPTGAAPSAAAPRRNRAASPT